MKKKTNLDLKRKLSINQPIVEPRFSQEQEMLGDMFGSNPNNKVLFGSSDSESLPQVNGILTSGFGLINSGDNERRTASMFGI